VEAITGERKKSMAVPTFTMKQLLEAGVHYGHNKRRWNPKMKQFIFGERNNIHIIDLQQTVPLLYSALTQVRNVAAAGGRVLFVGTKRQAADIVRDTAERTGQYYVNYRWLGGMLTNWKTISQSISRYNELEEQLSGTISGLTKKEILNLSRQRDKMALNLKGIKDMGNRPDIIIILDTNREDLAIAEAKKLGIPVVGILDTNSTPDDIDFPIPGNDDALRAIELYCDLFAQAIVDGLKESVGRTGKDLGASAEIPAEEVAAVEAANDAAKEDVKEEAKEESKVKVEKKPAKKTAAKK